MTDSQSTVSLNSLTTWDRIKVPLLVALFATIPPLFFHLQVISRLFVMILIFSVLALALNIVFGHTDQLFLFVGALTGLGAYSTALTADYLGVSPWITIIPGAIFVGLIGLVVCYVAARRRFTVILISILTLALQFAIIEIFVGARNITGGSTGFTFSGLGLEPVQDALGVHEHFVLYYMLLGILTALLLFYQWLRTSKYGVAFNTIRQDEIAAEAIGVNVVRYKSIAGFVSAFIIGFIGPMYAQLEGIIFPGLFAFDAIDVLVLIILIIGGLRTTLGPVVGAAIVIMVNEELQGFGQWRTALFGFLLIVMFLYFRQGVVPYADKIEREHLRIRERFTNWLD
ncbi:branched-chain amino acid ABC transporter permease [Halostagnicola bangensis]